MMNLRTRIFLMLRCAMASGAMGLSGAAHALAVLTDELLSKVAGRDGVSIVVEGAPWSIGSVDYSQDGETLRMKGLSGRPVTGTSSLTTLKVDVFKDRTTLALSMPQTEYRIDDVILGTGARSSLGSLRGFFQTDATLDIKTLAPVIRGATLDSGVLLDGSLLLSDGTGYVRWNGYDIIAKGLRFGADFTDLKFSLPKSKNGNDIKLEFNNASLAASLTGISLDLAYGDGVEGVFATPKSPDTRDPNASKSFGGLSISANTSGSFTFTGGGAKGEGMRIWPDLSWRGGVFEYKGNGGVIRSSDLSGSISSQSGLTIDLEKDSEGSYIKFATTDLSVQAQLGSIVVGDPSKSKLGGVGLNLSFTDTPDQKNWLKIRPGGDLHAGAQGLSAQMGWNLSKGSVSLTDDGNSVWLSGLKSYGSGTMTLDLTRSCSASVAVPGCYAGTNSDPTKGNYNGFFDGLRLGLTNVSGSLSLDGIQVKNTSGPLKGGSVVLETTLNGQITLQPGGKSGDGIRFNADLFQTNLNVGLSLDQPGKGIWLTGGNSEMHYRNGSVDVTSAGLTIDTGESWTRLEANDVRLGGKDTGKSFGRVLLKTYETGSTLSLTTGGSGALCVGAVASNTKDCATAGGRWEERGSEGLSVKLKSIYARAATPDNMKNAVVTDEKRNQISLQTNRTLGADGKLRNGTGTQIFLDNFWTSDAKVGDSSANTFGLNADVGIDVVPTVVIAKGSPFTQTSALGIATTGRVTFKEIGAERVQTVNHTAQTGAQTLVNGMRLQNADIRFNLTATPMN